MKITLQLAETVNGIGAQGDRVTLALEPSDVHDPTELPEYLAGYKPFGYRADEVSPPLLVNNDEDKYRTFDSDDAFRRVNVKGSTQGAVPEVDPKSALNSYKVVERYIGSFVPAQTEGQSGNNYQPVMAASRRCKRALMLDREIDAMTLVGSVGNWNPAQVTPAAGTGWADLIAGDPILDVETMIEASAQPVSAIWFNQKIAHRFLRHPKVREHMRQLLGDGAAQSVAASIGSLATSGQTADFLIPGLPPFKVVASKMKNETTGLLDYVLGDVAVGVTVPPGVPQDGEEISTTYTFRRRGPSGTGLEVREFRVEGRGPLGGTMIVVSAADIPVMTGNNAGGIITGV